jgi:pimeloyl-ACP methyl ester carboxylesterase
VNATREQTGVKPTIVLVHGAFADASSWNGVIERLQQQGHLAGWRRRAGA